MKKINAYKTTDGELFEIEKDAINHQKEINLREDLIEFLGNKDTALGFDDKFVSFVVEYKEQLLEILKNIE